MNLKKQFIITILLFCSILTNAQTFQGLTAFKELIEYEGQRFLMDEVYDITKVDFDKLKIDKTIKEVDSDEGFMFVLASYVFNEKKGIVITSFSSRNFQNTKHNFVNVHLTDAEYRSLYNTFKELEKNQPNYDEHILRKFNERLISDANNEAGIIYFTLWVDTYNRHTFTPSKWDRAFKRYKKFTE